MRSIKILVSLPPALGEKLKAEKARGVSASGLVRYLLEKHFSSKKAAKPIGGHHERTGTTL